jgi:PAS domain S-box-containing protein
MAARLSEAHKRAARCAHYAIVRNRTMLGVNAVANGRVLLSDSSVGLNLSVDAILEGIGEGFFALGPDWRFVAFNRAAEDLFGLKRSDVLGRLIWEVSPRIVGTEFERRYRRVMIERVRQEFESYTVLRADRFHEIRAFPLGDGIGVSFRDATARRQAIEALREREAELARVQRIGGVGGVQVDLRGDFRGRRSPEYLRLHGLPSNRVNESHTEWLDRIHPEDRPGVEKNFLDAISGEDTTYQVEYRIIRPNDGKVRWIRAVAEIERDEQGAAITLIGAHLDITERKEAEQQTIEREQQLAALADALPLLISYVDREQRYRFVNKTYGDWFERPLNEILGKTLEEVLGAAMYEARLPFIERALAGETLSYEVDFPRSSGVVVTQALHAPHRDAAGDVSGFYAVVQDITDRKFAEKALSESEERFRSIANSAPVPIWVSRLDGGRAFVNYAYQEFLGLPFEECLNYDWRKSLHPDDLARILHEQRVGEGSRRPFVLEARYRRKDGAWRWLRSESQPRWGPAGEHIGFIGVAHDITIWKEAEQKLAQINETLERRVEERTRELHAAEEKLRHAQKMEAVGQLTGGIAHDFNNLLTGIISALDLIRRRIGAGRLDDLDRFMDAASNSATRAAALTHRLLAFARRQPLDPKTTDVNKLISSVEDLLRRTLGEQIVLRTNFTEALWPAFVDPNQLESAILNLAINARDAMPGGGELTLTTSNTNLVETDSQARSTVPGAFVAVSVSDTGLGMTPEVLARAFDPFFTTKPIGQGTGLGLSMIYGFVTQSDGHIRIKSQVGQGTTIQLYFPRSLTTAKTGAGGYMDAAPAGKGETILVVEDEPAVRLLVGELLAEFGYQTIEAFDASSAMEILRSNKAIDMMITDIGLPGVDGVQLAGVAREIRRGLKILLMTGYAEKAAQRSSFLEEKAPLIAKPFTAEAFGKQIHDILRR